MNKRIYTLLLALTVALTSCYRDDLCFFHPDGALIELKLDWSLSQLQPNSATAIIYKDGRYFRTEIFSVHPPVRKEIFLPVGTYSLVVHNEQKGDFERSLHFAGTDSWSTLEARTIDDYMANLLSRAPSGTIKAEVDTLAVDKIVHFEVTQEMVPESHVDPTPLGQAGFNKPIYTLLFRPQRVFTMVDILLKVKNGMGYFFTQRNPALLQGTAESYLMTADRYATSTVSHAVKFVQLPKANNSDVLFRASLQVVGLRDYHDPTTSPSELDYRMNLPFTFSGGITIKDIDLRLQSKQFVYTPRYTNGRPHDHLYIEIELELEPLIDVGGMNANVEDWNEVDIPLDGPQRLHFLANNGSKEAAWWPCIPGVEVNLLSPFFITPVANLSFREWNSNPDGSGTAYASGETYLMKRGGAIFYAIWDRTDLPDRALHFMANDGTDNEITAKRKPGLLIPIPHSLFTAPAGKQFKEWNSNSLGTGIRYTPDQSFRVPDQETWFYAIWR